MIYTEDIKKTLNEVVEKNKTKGRKWTRVADEMNRRFGLTVSKDAYRIQYRKQNNLTLVTQRAMQTTQLSKAVLSKLSKKRNAVLLCKELSITMDELMRTVSELQLKGYRGVTMWNEGGDIYIQNIITQGSFSRTHVALQNPDKHGIIRFAVVSDTHIGNKCADLSSLHSFYDYVRGMGITTVLHAGDITDGYYTNRPTSIFEQDAIGFTSQLDMVVDKYPQVDGITTYFITGNHDYTHLRNGAADIGAAISAQRKDLVYLGHNFAKVPITERVAATLKHPTDGTPTSLSLRLQQIIDKNESQISDLLFVGHYHKACSVYYKGVYGFLCPSFERPTSFMKDNNLTSLVGGLIITLRVSEEGELLSVTSEYVALD